MSAMRTDMGNSIILGSGEVHDGFFCKLFDDMIIKDVCLLRRRELNHRSWFSCSGCSKDTLISGTRAGLNLRVPGD